MSDLVGIVAINSRPLEFNFPYPDSMLPIAKDFLAVERAILECAYVGCESIWIISPYYIQPFFKQRIGEIVQDPVWFWRQDYASHLSRKEIPIYYICTNYKDKDKRDSLVWNTLDGCRFVRNISGKISNFLIPKRFYIAPVFGLYPYEFLREYRDIVRDSNNFSLFFKNESILNGLNLGITLNLNDVKFLISKFKEKATGCWDPTSLHPEKGYPTKKLPLEERFSGKFLTFKDVFSELQINPTSVTVDWYYDLSTWDGYRKYMGSNDKIKKPEHPLLKARNWKGISN